MNWRPIDVDRKTRTVHVQLDLIALCFIIAVALVKLWRCE